MQEKFGTPLDPLIERVYSGVHWRRAAGEHPSCIRRALTQRELKKHLNGGPAVGVAPIEPGTSSTRIALIDFDSHKGETPWSEMVDTALVVIDKLDSAGLRAIPFRSSGGKGIHLLMLWEEPQDARSVRTLISGLLADCGLAVGTGGVAKGQVEVFPKQDSVPPDGVGSMFLLPLAGESVPLDPLGLEPIEPGEVIWTASQAVPTVEPAEKPVEVRDPGPLPELDLVRSAIEAIPNCGEHELDYDSWFRVICAIHHATGGSEQGLELAHEFSRKSGKYDERFLDERCWPYIRDREDGITWQTLIGEARRHGWNDDLLDEFDDLGPLTEEERQAVEQIAIRPPADLPPLDLSRDDSGRILATVPNVLTAIRRPDWLGIQIGYDTFKDQLMWAPPDTHDWRPFRDVDYTRVRLTLEQAGFRPVSAELASSCVKLAADEHQFDSAIHWLENEVPAWDGEPRCEFFYPRYLKTVDSPYTRAIGLYQWSAMAARTLQPGAKADMIPIWISGEGTRKTSSVSALVVSEDLFVDVSFEASDDNQARRMRGRQVGEIAELHGLHTRAGEAIKAWVTRRHDTWTPKYAEFTHTYPRRIFLIGTGNEDEILTNDSGERRWLPVVVGDVDLEAIERDRLQLWAEGRELFKRNGVMWQGVDEKAREARRGHRVRDPWEELILPYLDVVDPGSEEASGEPRKRVGVNAMDVLRDVLCLDAGKIGRREQMRVANIFKSVGLVKGDGWRDGRSFKVWRLPE